MKLLNVFAVLALSTTAVAAQPFYQGHELPDLIGGYTFTDGSNGYKDTNGSRTQDNPDIVTIVDNPDIVTSHDELVSPATHDSAPNTSLQSFGHCPPMRTMNGGWTARTNVNADCTALSIVPGSGGRSAVYKTVTTTTDGGTTTVVTDGGTTTIPTCDRSSVSLGFTPGSGFTADFSSSSSDGSC